MGVLKRHDVDEGEGELGADFTSFHLPREMIWLGEGSLPFIGRSGGALSVPRKLGSELYFSHPHSKIQRR